MQPETKPPPFVSGRKAQLIPMFVASLSKRQTGPFFLRLMSVGASLLTNILVARRLTLDQIGIYYLYVALAYVGNAGFYVGIGVVLQRQCASLAHASTLHKSFLLRFLILSLLSGTLLVTLLSTGYLYRQFGGELWQAGLWCAALSGATYVSSVSKDLLALGKKLAFAASLSLAEQILRLVFVAFATSGAAVGALEIVGASVLALTFVGVSGLIVLLTIFRPSLEPASSVTARDALHTVAPISTSGLLNWLQLQAYRPALLYLDAHPSVIGITSLLTVLGMTGANPLLATISQAYIPSLYSSVPYAFQRCLKALLKFGFGLAAISLPFASVFLYLSGRSTLLFYVLIAPIGVLVEAGNNVIGAFMHDRNSRGESMWVLAVAGSIGVVTAILSWIVPIGSDYRPYVLAIGMILSQFVVILFLAFNRKARVNREHVDRNGGTK